MTHTMVGMMNRDERRFLCKIFKARLQLSSCCSGCLFGPNPRWGRCVLGHLGPILEHLGAYWGLLGPSWEHLGTRTQHAVTKTPPKNLKNTLCMHTYTFVWRTKKLRPSSGNTQAGCGQGPVGGSGSPPSELSKLNKLKYKRLVTRV